MLVSALAHLTGDLTHDRPLPRPAPVRPRSGAGHAAARRGGGDPGRGRSRARPRRTVRSRVAAVDDASLHRIMEFCAGEEVAPEYVPLVEEEANFDGDDRRRFVWRRRRRRRRGAPELPRGHHRRRPGRPVRGDPARAGGDPVHGVREERRRRRHLVREHLPRPAGRRPQPLLLYSFRPNPDWSTTSPAATSWPTTSRPAPRSTACCRTSASAPRCWRPTSTRRAGWWVVQLRDADGDGRARRGRRADQRGRHAQPARRSPTCDGLDTFAGPWFHSSRWDHDVDLSGKRVAVIGTGASAMQFVPAIAPEVEQLTIFQRSRHWVTPNPNYHRAGDRRREVAVPPRALLRRAGTASSILEQRRPHVPRVPRRPRLARPGPRDQPHQRQAPPRHDRRTSSASSRRGRSWSRRSCPTTRALGKRMLQDNGWFRTLLRDDVDARERTGRRRRTATRWSPRRARAYPADVHRARRPGSSPTSTCGR